VVVALVPVLRSDRHARMFGLGSAGALVLACSTHPHNRLLFYVGLGVMPLLSLAWHALLERASQGQAVPKLANALVAALVGLRLLISPLLLPLTACSVAITAPAEAGARSLLASGAGREVVLVSSPDYFHLKLAPVLAALETTPPPAHLFALSFGDLPLAVRRLDAHTLKVGYAADGLLASALLALYRSPNEPLPVGSRVALDTVDVQVTAHNRSGRVSQATFRFRTPLDDARFAFLVWDGARYAPFVMPAVGKTTPVPGAPIGFGL
jgi:hypothetical protein